MRPLLDRVNAYLQDREQITAEQYAAITSTSRLAVVRACPGSGKTRAFAARFAFDVATMTSHTRGVAALSFTNVAQREVRARVRALGLSDNYPHFVGTIDSFLLRFVVRRFASNLIRLDRFSHPVPDGDYASQSETIEYDAGRARLSSFRYAVDGGRFCLERVGKDQEVSRVSAAFKDPIVEAKKRAWQAGEVTYSDIVAIGLRLLRDTRVAQIVAGRFPRILVDEMQDTTTVREECLRRLFLAATFDRGLVVGDPDQCIMDFAGARPDVFSDLETIEGAAPYRFSRCFRAHQGLVDVVAPLRDGGGVVQATRERTAGSGTILLSHTFTVVPKEGVVASITSAFDAICEERGVPPSKRMVLAWADADVQRLGGMRKKSLPLKGPPFHDVLEALRCRTGGNMLECFQRIERLLSRFAFGSARPPSRADLQSRGLGARNWRARVMRVGDAIAERHPDETVTAWCARVRREFESACRDLTGISKSLGHVLSQKCDPKAALQASITDYLPDASDVRLAPIRTIHQVKGQEFTAVCVYIPRAKKGVPIAEAILLRSQPPNPDALSARRVLYVGMTRAIDILLLAVPAVWIEHLSDHPTGQQFIAGFDDRIAL